MGETAAPVPPITAIYARASNRSQDTASQELELKRWVEAQRDITVRWYRDKFTGTTMDCPMTTADDILGMLRDDMVSHGFFARCIADGGGSFSLESRVGALLAELLSSGRVEIGMAKPSGPDYVEFVAWTGSVPERISRAMSAVSDAVGHDREFAYWLCLRENVDRCES
jgi:hypothetical protein